MRRHDARKWLHAILDLLPVILIPVFMIYSHRHNPVTNTELNVEYKYQSNEVNSLDDLVVGNIYELDSLYLGSDALGGVDFEIELVFDCLKGDFSYLNDYTLVNEEHVFNDNYVNYFNGNQIYYYVFIDGGTSEESFNISVLNGDSKITLTDTLRWFEPSFENLIIRFNKQYELDDFKRYFTQVNTIGEYSIPLPEYTNYNEIVSADLIGGETDTITDVFVNNFNSTVNTYFNMGNVFGLNGVYEWFNTNIFGGNAPTIIYSVWNIALYELLMDLLMLLYALFMWFIDFCQDLIDRCFTTSKGGKH